MLNRNYPGSSAPEFKLKRIVDRPMPERNIEIFIQDILRHSSHLLLRGNDKQWR